MLKACGSLEAEDMSLPWPEGMQEKRPEMTEKRYLEAADSEFWQVEAKRCLSCGACSAVCPTCYCVDLLDETATDGSVTRGRRWDNCFFAEHAKVAGGHDFRPKRAVPVAILVGDPPTYLLKEAISSNRPPTCAP